MDGRREVAAPFLQDRKLAAQRLLQGPDRRLIGLKHRRSWHWLAGAQLSREDVAAVGRSRDNGDGHGLRPGSANLHRCRVGAARRRRRAGRRFSLWKGGSLRQGTELR